MAKAKWNLDKVHSEIGFSVRHMMVTNVKGKFNEFDAEIEADLENFTDASIEFTIDVSSIDTNTSDRDDHLRSADFFDAEKHPNIIFKATDIKKKSDNKYDVTGDFTMMDVTKPVTFDITFEGVSKDPMSGEEVAGFTGSTTIQREDFGLTWNAALETGGVLVSNDVKINIALQIRK